LSVLLQQRVGIVELAQLLKKQPPWRQDFFIYLSQTKNLPDVVHDFLLALRKNGVALQSAELRVTLNALLRQSFADRAYFVWLNTLSRDDLNVAGRVYDGEFTRVSDNQFFDWTILKRPTARIGVVPRPGDAADNMLSLKFYNDVGLFRHVQQYVRLQPGRFQLSFEQMASDLQTEAGLFWAIRCLKSKSLLGNSKALKTSGPWIASNFAFEVPAQNCDTQVLSLESATRSTLDMKVNGQIAYDRFVISPY